MRPVHRIGVCGLGSIGSAHARALAALGVELVLCDSSAQALELAASLPGVSGTTTSFAELLDAPLDGLVVATPEPLHVEQASAAILRGIPLLLEKPVADSAEGAAALHELQRRTGTPVLVGYVLRHSRVMARARSLVAAGAVGAPLGFQVMLGAYETLELARSRFTLPVEGRLLLDYSHEWDYLQWLLGPVSAAIATCRTAGDLPLTEAPNLADGVLQMASGVAGTFHLDYVQRPGRRHLTIVGDGGTMDVDAGLGLLRVQGRDGTALREHREPDGRMELLTRQAGHLLEVVAGRAAPAVTLADGLAAVRVAAALLRSSRERAWAVLES